MANGSVPWIEGLQRVGGLGYMYLVLKGDSAWSFPGRRAATISDLSAVVLCHWADADANCAFRIPRPGLLLLQRARLVGQWAGTQMNLLRDRLAEMTVEETFNWFLQEDHALPPGRPSFVVGSTSVKAMYPTLQNKFSSWTAARHGSPDFPLAGRADL
eukprot:5447951-Pyramimonas_sp.AAC.1